MFAVCGTTWPDLNNNNRIKGLIMNRHKRIPVILLLGLLAACSGANPTAYAAFSNESADLVLTGGKIFTVDDDLFEMDRLYFPHKAK